MASTNLDNSTRILTTTKIVWHDPKINSEHNKKVLQELRLRGYNISAFPSIQESMRAVNNALPDCIVMTSANKGEDLVKELNHIQNLVGVIVFCLSRTNGENVKSKCRHNTEVCIGSTNLLSILQDYSKRGLLFSAVSLAQPRISLNNAASLIVGNGIASMYQSRPNIEQYYCFKPEQAIDFSLVKLLFTGDVSAKSVMDELILLDKSRNKETEIRKFFVGYMKSDFNLLETFCKVYSSHLVFKKLNNCFAKGEYFRVIKSLLAVLRELKKENNQNKVFRPQYPREHLFRGVEKKFINLNDYPVGAQGFLPGFTSTSLTENVALEFAETDGIVFKISLSRNKPHPNIKMNDISLHSYENEVLLLPFFALRVTNVEEVGNYTYIHMEQREEASVLSLEPDETWISQLEQQLWPGIEDEINRVCEDFCSSLHIREKLQSQEFREAFCKDIRALCIEVLPNHDIVSWKSILTESATKKQVQDAISQAFNQRKSKLIADMLQQEIMECKQRNQEGLQKLVNVEKLWEPKNAINTLQDLDRINYVFGLWKDIPDNDNDPATTIRKLAALLETIAQLAPQNSQLSEIYNDQDAPASVKAAYMFYQYLNISDDRLEEVMRERLWEDFNDGVVEACNTIDNCSMNLIGECKESFLAVKGRMRQMLRDTLRRPGH